jgi:hypothetical protein
LVGCLFIYLFVCLFVACSTLQVATHSGFERLLQRMFDRINTADGMYQMVGVLGDGVVFRCDQHAGSGGENASSPSGAQRADYLEEMPAAYFNQRFDRLPRLFVQFGYGKQHRSLHTSRHQGTLFQVHLWYYPGDCTAAEQTGGGGGGGGGVRKKEVIELYEDFHTNWNSWELRVRVGRWLHAKVESLVAGSSEPPRLEEWREPAECDKSTVGAVAKRCVMEDPTARGCVETKAASLCECLQRAQPVLRCCGSCWSMVLDALKCPVTDAETTLGATASPFEHRGGGGARDARIWWKAWGGHSETAMALFSGGRADINVENRLHHPVELLRLTSFDEDAVPESLGNIQPGAGKRFISHERERWTARVAGRVVREWTVDIADGIVQDVVLW